MNNKEDQNYYTLLELPHNATRGEIQVAYEMAKKTYKDGSMASYSLFDGEGQAEILEKIEEAYRVLSDSKKKQKYDQALAISNPGLSPPDQAISPPPVEEPIPEEITGEVIKTLREKNGISLEEIAETTRINIDYLSAIEKSRFASLPAEVYVRSYLRQMVKIIRCDDTVVEGFMKQYHASLSQKR